VDLLNLKALREQHGYYPSYEQHDSRTSAREQETCQMAIDDNEVLEMVKRNYRESIKRKMEILEKTPFAEDLRERLRNKRSVSRFLKACLG